MSPNTQTTPRGSSYGWFLFGLVALFYCYEYLLRIAPSVMSKELMQYFALNATGFGNLFAVYYYIYTPMQIPVGLMLDRWGARLLISGATLICAIGTYIFCASHELLFAQIGRFMVGFGSAFAFVGVLKVASVWLPPERFGMVAGLTTTLGMLGGMFGGNIMAIFVQDFGWKETLYGSAIFGLMLTIIIWHYLRDSIKNGQSQNKPEPSETPSKQVTFRTLFLDCLKLMKKPQILLVSLIGGILYTSLSVFAELWGIPYLHQAKGFTIQSATGLMSTVFFGWAVGGPFIGLISDKINDRRLPLTLGALLGAIAIAVVIYGGEASPWALGCLLFLFGVFSSAENLCFAVAKESSESFLAGSAIALTNMFVMLIGAILQPIVGLILDISWDGTVVDGVHHYNNASFQYALLFLPVAYLFAAGLSLLLRKSHSQDAI